MFILPENQLYRNKRKRYAVGSSSPSEYSDGSASPTSDVEISGEKTEDLTSPIIIPKAKVHAKRRSVDITGLMTEQAGS